MRLTTSRVPFNPRIATSGALHAGIGQVEIPVWNALDLTGFIARENPCIGSRDALCARALALCDGGRPALVMVADCLGYSAEFVAAVHAEFPDADVFLAATHTHAAPASQILREAGTPDPTWMMLLKAALVDAGEAALRSMQLASLSGGTAMPQAVVAVNRRADSPDDLIDAEVSVLQVRDSRGKPLANLIHFACHPITAHSANRFASADWSGAVCRNLQAATGAFTLCLTGACGDINPARMGSWPELDWMAEHLTRAALGAIEDGEEFKVRGISSRRLRLNWRCEPAPDADFLEAFIREHTAKTPENSTEARVIKAYMTWAQSALRAGTAPASIDVEYVQAMLGDIVLVGVPGELFVEIGLEIKSILKEKGYRDALVCGYTNGNIGYIPTRRAYAARGYEIEQAHRYYGLPAVLSPEAGESLVASCRDIPQPTDTRQTIPQ